MSEPYRVHGPSGPQELPGAKKDRTVGPNDFKKYMVEEVKEIDPHQKRNRRRRQEEEEDIEEAKKAINTAPPTEPPPIGQVSAPASKQPSTAQPISLSSAPPPSTTTPLAEFSAESIEEYAWQEDTSSTATPPSSQPPTQQAAPPPPSTTAQQQPTALSSQAAFVEEEPTYTPTEQVEEAPPPPSRYGAEDYESPVTAGWEEYPTAPARAVPTTQEESAQTRAEAQSKKAAEPESPLPSKKKAKKPIVPEQMPSKAALPPKLAGKALPSEEVAALEAEAAKKPKAARKKGKAPPILGQEEKRAKGTSADFKKLMEEAPKPSAEEEQIPEEEPKASPSAAPKKGKKASFTTKPSPKVPLPVLEKIGGKALVAATPGTLPPDLSSTKKAPTDKLPTKKAKEKEEPTEVEEEGLAIPPLTQAAASTQGEAGGEKRRRGPGEFIAEPAVAPTPAMPLTSQGALPTTTGVSSTSPYAELHPEILDLFERLVGVMTVMQTAGISETTMTLNEKTFANSSLLGASITIRTYDIAPKEMNVEFSGSPQALAQMQQNLPSLLAAFQAGNYNFVVKRFDFKVSSTERPIFRRKEELRDRGGNDQQQNEEERE